MQTVSSTQQKNRGFYAGCLVASASSFPLKYANTAILNKMRNSSLISEQDSISLSNAVQKALEQTGLKKDGVEVIKVSEVAKNGDIFDFSKDLKALDAAKTEVKSCKKIKNVIAYAKAAGMSEEEAIENAAKGQLLAVRDGSNAFYLRRAKKIVTPDKHLQTSVFHEMGHALNAKNAILNAMQGSRAVAMKVPAAVLLVSLLNSKKQGEKRQEQPKVKYDTNTDSTWKNFVNGTKNVANTIKSGITKSADFIKDNAIVITGLSMVPTIIEEAVASIRGEKIAKDFVENKTITKDLLKTIKKTNRIGLATYALSIIAAMAVVKAAIFTKDKFQEGINFKAKETTTKKLEGARLQGHQA